MVAVCFVLPSIVLLKHLLVFLADSQLQIGSQVTPVPQNTQQQRQQQQTTGTQHQQQQNIAQQLLAQSVPQRTLLPQNYVAQLGQVIKLKNNLEHICGRNSGLGSSQLGSSLCQITVMYSRVRLVALSLIEGYQHGLEGSSAVMLTH